MNYYSPALGGISKHLKLMTNLGIINRSKAAQSADIYATSGFIRFFMQNQAQSTHIQLSPEQQYTQRCLSYLSALYQGRFAMLTILGQTGHSFFKPAEIKRTLKIIQTVYNWNDEFLKGRFLFSTTAGMGDKSFLVKCHTLVKSLAPELESIARKVKEIKINNSLKVSEADNALMLAILGRSVYSRDAYLKHQIVNSYIAGDLERLQGFARVQMDSANYIHLLNSFLNTRKESGILPAEQQNQLLFHARMLPGTFRSYVHDINQILAWPDVELSFTKAGFLQVEAEVWQAHGFTAIEAGYWRAYEFTIEQTMHWKSFEVHTPQFAADWHYAGFTPEKAQPWIDVLLSATLALVWGGAGYTPKQARECIDQGYKFPDQVTRKTAA